MFAPVEKIFGKAARRAREIQSEWDEFIPSRLAANAHLMTIIPSLMPRASWLAKIKSEKRYVEVAPDSKVLIHLDIEQGAKSRPTLLIVHGLEGSADSHYVVGLAVKALAHDFNVVRMNMRNCGGTLHLSPTLYNAGMSDDLVAVLKYLKEKEGLTNIIPVGYSLGGNIILKALGELSSRAPKLVSGACAISPALDLPKCVNAVEVGFNRLYELRFIITLKQKIRRKSRLFPDRFDASFVRNLHKLRDFDETYTAPDGGYESADDYYTRASSLPIVNQIAAPTLIITAKDDPLVPFESFEHDNLKNPNITLLAPGAGGHGGFMHNAPDFLHLNHGHTESHCKPDVFWAENRLIEYCHRRFA